MSEHDQLRLLVRQVEAVRRAIRDPGSHPAYHREVMERHRKEWPTLWKALDALLQLPPNAAQDGGS